MSILVTAFQNLIKVVARAKAKDIARTVGATAGGVTCGPACAFLAGTLAGLVLEQLFTATDAEQRAADQEAQMKRILLEMDFQKGVRRLEELNAMRSGRSAAPLSDVKLLLTEARGFFLNASASRDFPLLSVRSDCYVGSCNALLLQPDLQNYERAYGACLRLEGEYVEHPSGWWILGPKTPVIRETACPLYSRRAMLWQLKNAVPSWSDAYRKPVELYEHMGPLAALLTARGSRVPGLLPAAQYNYDRYIGLWADAREKFMNCPKN